MNEQIINLDTLQLQLLVEFLENIIFTFIKDFHECHFHNLMFYISNWGDNFIASSRKTVYHTKT